MTFTTGIGFVLGTMHFGSAVDQPTTNALLDRFHEAGGRVLDTANNYRFWIDGCTGDESELAIGAWLRDRGIRDEVTISTKVGARPRTPGDRTLDDVEGLSVPAINAGIDASLRRLGTDHVDVYWTHIDDHSVPIEETARALHDLVTAGKVRQTGSSNTSAWRLERARTTARHNGLTPFTHLQLRHTYLRPRPNTSVPDGGHVLVSDETLAYVNSEPDLTLWAYNTLMTGAYTRPDRPITEIYDHPGTTRRLAVLREVAAELGATANQVVLAWLMADGIVPIVGVSKMTQLEEAIGAAAIKLDDDVRHRLDATC